jgi:hypothetical protein
LVALAVASLAFAGPKEELAAASAAGDLQKLFAIATSAPDESIRQEGVFQFATALRARRLPVAAYVYFGSILKNVETHPFYFRSVEQSSR